MTQRQDYEDWKGFDARVRLAVPHEKRKQFDGRIDGIEGEHLKLHAERVGEVLIPFASIASAKLLLTDALIKATAPLSTEGADTIVHDVPPESLEDLAANDSKEG